MHLRVDSTMVALWKDANWLELFGPKDVLNRPYCAHVWMPTMTTFES